ncbi:aspartyl/asparaginyl beta-hydroxylase domain-containing protein [Fluviicola chungangensis]|uniref:Aspartyl/asparaginyl beta-hydroxylase domain-containing protein n=1 Tax=Fluviicola chungangensis TaxID=2597671 RepID=A0A556MGX6_9FLAO|nr:aspartyl/asparaginyl beta-hydroxylase domain-containing protein [Fluviicola chungangensis]TSJ39072.1 aspartyl/asparaginyl beta-hydroxylase domain-containing protein [Fluviicola chungangensis]
MSKHAITKYLKFPVQFDEQRLVLDLAKAMEGQWVPHFNTGGYTGNWKAVSLYAADGNEQNIFAHLQDQSAISETPLMKECTYFREVLDYFQFPVLSVRLLRLEAGAVIKPHTDHELGYEDGQFRLHIPIVTNPEIEFILDGERLTMLPGECWYTNVNLVHSVANRGREDRVHLVIDGVRNDWTDELFFSLAPESSFEVVREEKLSRETLIRMLEELRNNPQMAGHPLVLELEAKLTKAD